MFGTYNRLNVSVFASNRAVIRAARAKLRPETLRDRDLRAARHQFLRQMLAYHANAKELANEWRLF